jgi:hypothetical protein
MPLVRLGLALLALVALVVALLVGSLAALLLVGSLACLRRAVG